jgi:hypothetical protein
LWDGDYTLAEGLPIEFVEGDVVNCYSVEVGGDGIKETEEEEYC